MVHRKGATRARLDEIGLIPGSQGTASYVVKGKGNPESFMSCSHGAGRRMGRKEAARKLNLEEEIKKMNDKGIIHGIRTVKDLDESSSAYKDIHTVMLEQRDLVDEVTTLRPLAVIKG
jgi:tRNA-splicing ligase RtcB